MEVTLGVSMSALSDGLIKHQYLTGSSLYLFLAMLTRTLCGYNGEVIQSHVYRYQPISHSVKGFLQWLTL